MQKGLDHIIATRHDQINLIKNGWANYTEAKHGEYVDVTIIFVLPGVCKNTQKLPEPHKTKEACDAAGDCEWRPVESEKAAKAVYRANPEYMLGFITDKSQKAYFKALPKKMKKYQKLSDLPITLQELKEHLPGARKTITSKTKYHLDSGKFVPLRKKQVRTGKKNRKIIYSNSVFRSEEHTMRPSGGRRLAEAARMEEKDMDAMSPSQLALHRRRLTHGAHVSPVLAALMDEIEQAQRNN